MTSAESEGDTAQDVATLHGEIDRLDERVRNLLIGCRDLSRRIQDLRAGAGYGGVQPSREEAMIAGHVDLLGDGGRDVVEAVLRLCRGAADGED